MGFSQGERPHTRDDAGRDYERMKQKVVDELKKTFSPEFLNRLDDAVVFHALGEEEIRLIVDLQLQDVKANLAARGLSLTVTDPVRELLIREGFDPSMGARPLRRAVRNRIEDALAEHILAMGAEEHGEIVADMDDEGNVTFEFVQPTVPCQA